MLHIARHLAKAQRAKSTMSSNLSPKIAAPYGAWKSKIDVDSIFKTSTSTSEVYVDDVKNRVYHLENRPAEDGRSVLVDSISKHDLTPRGMNTRTRVHEYGGAPCTVRGGHAYLTDFAKSGIWKLNVGQKDGKPELVTKETTVLRYADFVVHPTTSKYIVSVREDHTSDKPSEVVNTLVCINTETKAESVVAQGRDFYSSPRFNKSGEMLCWLEWNHPDMPWDGAELHIAAFDLPSKSWSKEKQPILSAKTFIAGSPDSDAVYEPQWCIANDTKLFFCWDISGYANLYSVDVADVEKLEIRRAGPKMDYDCATPAWTFGMSNYCQLTERDMIILPAINSVTTLTHLDLRTRKTTTIENDYLDIASLRRVSDVQAVFLGSKATQGKTLTIMSLKGKSISDAEFGGIWFEEQSVDPALFGKPETMVVKVDFPPKGQGKDDESKEVDLHLVMYPPFNPEYEGEKGTLPPAIVMVHGGPTGRSVPSLNINYQYFTSRGFAVLDIDYGGSAGYGREYINRLRGNWGVVDVNDSSQAVTALGKLGKIDAKRVAIQGGSAGGFTTLASLTDNKVFSAGVSLFGVSDIGMLAADTHKFESQYLFRLVGGLPSEIPDVYIKRSPINKAENITADLILFQGLDDKVVPPAQAELLVKKIEAAHGKVEAIYYEGEGHGFRKLENMKTTLLRTEEFLKGVFGLDRSISA